MLRQVLALLSIAFVVICVGAIGTQFIDLSGAWAYLTNLYHWFDNEGLVKINSMPAGAAVYIDNKFVGQTPLKEEIAGGTYDIKLLLDGYQTFARRVTVEKRGNAFINARLSREYGTIAITSTPSNAVVFLDGKRQGQLTPLELKVEQGKYLVKVMKDQFYAFEEQVIVEQGKTMTVEADLVRQVGRMILETTPPGAKAYIGSDLIGTTPLTHDKPVGKYVITLKKPEFRDKVIEANIAPDEALEINVELAERAGALKVTTNPPGAELHINDAYQGETPIRVEKKPGVYQITLRRSRYREISEELVIEDNITKNIHRDLDPALGEFRIDSDPSHAKVWLDSENIGFTPITINKLPGIYTVRITKPGYRNYVEEVTIKEGAFIQLKPVLEKER
jgi:sporulation protein YlmC with PRC-barrel domain